MLHAAQKECAICRARFGCGMPTKRMPQTKRSIIGTWNARLSRAPTLLYDFSLGTRLHAQFSLYLSLRSRLYSLNAHTFHVSTTHHPHSTRALLQTKNKRTPRNIKPLTACYMHCWGLRQNHTLYTITDIKKSIKKLGVGIF